MSDSFATPWTIDHQAPLSMDFPGKNTVVGCHSLLPGTFPTRDQMHVSCIGRWILYHWTTREAHIDIYQNINVKLDILGINKYLTTFALLKGDKIEWFYLLVWQVRSILKIQGKNVFSIIMLRQQSKKYVISETSRRKQVIQVFNLFFYLSLYFYFFSSAKQ